MGFVVSNEELGHLTPLRYTAKLTWTSHGNSKFVDRTIKNAKKVLDVMKQWCFGEFEWGKHSASFNTVSESMGVCCTKTHSFLFMLIKKASVQLHIYIIPENQVFGGYQEIMCLVSIPRKIVWCEPNKVNWGDNGERRKQIPAAKKSKLLVQYIDEVERRLDTCFRVCA